MRSRIGVRVLQVGAPVASLSMRSPVDRRIAAVVLVLGVVSILLPTVIARDAATGDDAAAADLVALARRQERGSWLVDFQFTRALHNGGDLDQPVTEANRPPTHVTASGSTVTVDFGDKVASCTETGDGPRCIERRDDPSLASSVVYREVLRLGAYTVERVADRAIAGERAHCFLLVAKGRTWPQIGERAEQCYADDGVPLRSAVTGARATDTRTAVRVERDIPASALRALLDRLDREQEQDGG
jgi:hypothetical protein